MPSQTRFDARDYLLVICLAFSFTSGCGATPDEPIATATLEAGLTPYHTTTASPVPPTPALAFSSPTARPAPTPTPFTYTVVSGDTMLGIALRHGLSLEELMAANPEVNPRFLSVGSVLTLPLGSEELVMLPTPTPLPVNLSQPACYKTGDQGAWCIVVVENPRSRAMENISARILLRSEDGEILAEMEAIPPLNVLPGRGRIPLAVFFPPPLPDTFSAQSEILSAILVPEDDGRYLPASIILIEERITVGRRQATVKGFIEIADTSPPAQLIWIALVAYDDGRNVVGLRKWEATTSAHGGMGQQVIILDNPVEAGDRLPFEITVYSLGPAIAQVETLLEARP